ncbi:MAG TPA: hypothetical protein VE291_04705 [Terracidiphilus sp.]|jgi:MtN3 and saliva related transmembrane protein|nr:hypothetical protein [Terracidiphilus sp.]
MKEVFDVLFGVGLFGNALLFVPQAIALWRKKTDEGISLITFGGFTVLQIVSIVHGVQRQDNALVFGMSASLLSCGSVTLLTLYYRVRRVRREETRSRAIEDLKAHQQWAEEKGLVKMTDKEIDAEIAAVRNERSKRDSE